MAVAQPADQVMDQLRGEFNEQLQVMTAKMNEMQQKEEFNTKEIQQAAIQFGEMNHKLTVYQTELQKTQVELQKTQELYDNEIKHKKGEKNIANTKGIDVPKKLIGKQDYKTWAKSFLA